MEKITLAAIIAGTVGFVGMAGIAIHEGQELDKLLEKQKEVRVYRSVESMTVKSMNKYGPGVETEYTTENPFHIVRKR